MPYRIFLIAALILFSGYLAGYAQKLTDKALEEQEIYTSIEEALANPDKVYRLHLKGNLKSDSIPDAIFRLVNLQELSLRRCRLQVINDRIEELSHLRYLDLEHNRLVRLPESLCNLSELHTLIISRNMIFSLPENIGKMSKLERIEAWGNPLYVLPDGISLLSESLKEIDLRQIGFRKEEIERIEHQLPKTEILYTNICDCKNGRK